MVFGEILEPSSRALWDDELEDYLHTERKVLKWNITYNLPSKINKLLVIESESIIKFLYECTNIKESCKTCELENGALEIHEMKDGIYIAIFRPQKDCYFGEVLEMLNPWIENSDCVYTLTSLPIALLQNCDITTNPGCAIKCFKTNGNGALEMNSVQSPPIPNLIAGFTAGVYSFCTHRMRSCVMFIAYLDLANLDSITSKPLMELVEFLGLKPVKSYCLKVLVPNNNLYM